MTSNVDGWMVSPRKSRRKSACFSNTTTSTPARAKSRPSIIPAGPPPAMQHRTDIDFLFTQPFPADREQGQLLVRRPRDEAIGRVIVHQPNRLHVGVDDR